jgi:hypothetical protein
MRTIEQIEAEIAALQAELEARKFEPDLREAVGAFDKAYLDMNADNWESGIHAGLLACWPALYKALGPRSAEPTEAEDLAMAEEVFRSFDYLGHVTDVIVAAFKAERKRAGGGK